MYRQTGLSDNHVEEINKVIDKGERTRVLFQILLSDLELNYQTCTSEKFFEELKRTQQETNEALELLRTIAKDTFRKQTDKGVSASD